MKPISFLTAVLLALVVFSAQAKDMEEVNNYLKQTVIADFTVDNMAAADALASVQSVANLNQNHIYFNIAAIDKIKSSTVTLSLKNTSAYDLIAAICAACDVKFAVRKDQVLIFDAGKDTNAPSPSS